MVVNFSINVADAAMGLRRASKNKEMWTKKHYSVRVLLL